MTHWVPSCWYLGHLAELECGGKREPTEYISAWHGEVLGWKFRLRPYFKQSNNSSDIFRTNPYLVGRTFPMLVEVC